MAWDDGSVSDLVEFLRARIDEDEAKARGATSPGSWTIGNVEEPFFADVRYMPADGDPPWAGGAPLWVTSDSCGSPACSLADAEHIARHDPARVLREAEAKRQLIERYEENIKVRPNDEHHVGIAVGLLFALYLAAQAYADHPDYDPAWRPSG